MMKLELALLLATTAAVGACGATSKDPGTSSASAAPNPGTATPEKGVPCAQETAMVCPDGQVDACLKTPPDGDTHRCVNRANKCASEGGTCVQKVATVACKRFEDGAEYGCPGAGSGCCLNN